MGLNAQATRDVDALIASGDQAVATLTWVSAIVLVLGGLGMASTSTWYHRIYERTPPNGLLKHLVYQAARVVAFVPYISAEMWLFDKVRRTTHSRLRRPSLGAEDASVKSAAGVPGASRLSPDANWLSRTPPPGCRNSRLPLRSLIASELRVFQWAVRPNLPAAESSFGHSSFLACGTEPDSIAEFSLPRWKRGPVREPTGVTLPGIPAAPFTRVPQRRARAANRHRWSRLPTTSRLRLPSGITSPGDQLGTALLSVGGSAGLPSVVSSLNRNPAIRLSFRVRGRTAVGAYRRERG
jgi:hypothetical protein